MQHDAFHFWVLRSALWAPKNERRHAAFFGCASNARQNLLPQISVGLFFSLSSTPKKIILKIKMERHFFDYWLLLHIIVGALGRTMGLSQTTYVVSHITYEIISNTEGGMRFLNRIPFWPPKPNIDKFENVLGDPFWGWVGWSLTNNNL